MELKRVVVTGLGAITPLGNDVESTWKNALAGVSGAGPITHFDTTLFKTKFACEVKGFKAEDYVPAGDRHALRDFKKFDLYTQYAMAAAKQAVEDAGLLSDDKLDRDQVGVIFGSGIGGIHTFEQEVSYYAKNEANGPKYSPFLIPAMIADMAAGRISIEYGFRGPNYGVVSACATSTNAMIDAFTYVRTGKAPVIVTGGSEAPICPVGVGGFNSMKALSTRNDSPETASRPFSASRDGFVIGEGGVCLIFEELEHALARGAKIYGEVIGGGMSADAYHITASHPEGLGAKLVMERAIEDAGITPDDVDYINVHGTSQLHQVDDRPHAGRHRRSRGSVQHQGLPGGHRAPHHQPRGGRQRPRHRLQAQLHLQQGTEAHCQRCIVQHLRLRRSQRQHHREEVQELNVTVSTHNGV